MENRQPMQEMLADRFENALVYTTRLHRGQLRKGSRVPYVSHLLAVAGLVLEAGGNEDETIAALLHDGPEDKGGEDTLDDIRYRFGDRVANIVAACSDTFEEVKPPWEERKRTYLAHLANAPASVLLVSCADKLHNARTISADYRSLGEALWERFRGGKEGTLWYYRALIECYAAASQPPVLLGELERAVSEIEALVCAGQ